MASFEDHLADVRRLVLRITCGGSAVDPDYRLATFDESAILRQLGVGPVAGGA
jgi:hypothetical protein